MMPSRMAAPRRRPRAAGSSSSSPAAASLTIAFGGAYGLAAFMFTRPILTNELPDFHLTMWALSRDGVQFRDVSQNRGLCHQTGVLVDPRPGRRQHCPA